MPFDKLLCKVCAKHFHTVPDRKKHTRQCKKDTLCNNCNLWCSNFSTIHNFKIHISLYKGSFFQCPFCQNKMFTCDQYDKCKRPYARCTRRICKQCQKVLDTPEHLIAHSSKEHATFTCNIYHCFFNSEAKLEQHKNNMLTKKNK